MFLNLTKCMHRIRIRATTSSRVTVCKNAEETRTETTEQRGFRGETGRCVVSLEK